MGGRSQEEITMDDATAARIEGKIDLINERHERFTQDMTSVSVRLNGHSERIGELEKAYHKAEGISSTIKLVWIVGGAVTGTSITIAIALLSWLTNTGV